jgi:arsenite methyltransferase
VHSSLLEHLVDPVSRAPLTLVGAVTGDGDEIEEGLLRSPDGREYPIRRGIPRFVAFEDAGQQQTGDSFGYKWRQQEAFNSDSTREWARNWLLERYGFASAADMRAHLAGAGRVLDAGCGSGYSAVLWLAPGWSEGTGAEWFGVDVSEAVDVARDTLHGVEGTHFIQADILQLPFRDETFGAAFSEGVLHHTPSTERAFASVVSTIQVGGELLVYVYRKKGPIREYSDDFIRALVASLPPAKALEQMMPPLTDLARALAETEATVVVSRDVPYLGIEAGEYPLQRFVYWHFLKAFWNDAFTLEGNNLVNFDWYHPRYAHRHTEEELRTWCQRYGVDISRFEKQESGFTVRALKRGGDRAARVGPPTEAAAR